MIDAAALGALMTRLSSRTGDKVELMRDIESLPAGALEGAEDEHLDDGAGLLTSLCDPYSSWRGAQRRELVGLLLARGADPNRAIYGITALYNAAAAGDIELARALLDAGAEPAGGYEFSDGHDETPLHVAARSESLDMLELLIERGASRDAGDWRGATPLLVALWDGASPRVIARLATSSSVAVAAYPSNADRPAPAHAAIEDIDALRLVLELGADVSATDHLGNQPLHLAAMNGEVESIALLLERGADASAHNFAGQSPWALAVDDDTRAALPEVQPETERSAATVRLHELLEELERHQHRLGVPWDERIAPILNALEEGADASRADRRGVHPLHRIAKISQDLSAVVHALVDAGAVVDARFPGTEYRGGWTPLCVALDAYGPAVNTALALIDRGADVASPCGAWSTSALHLSKGRTEIIERLLALGADPNLLDGYGRAPLSYVLDSAAATKLLLAVTDQEHIRVALTDRLTIDVLPLLLEAGADPSALGRYGGNAAHSAAGQSSVEVLRAVIAAGADPHLPRGDGKTPADLARACQGDSDDLEERLAVLGASPGRE